MAISLAPTHLKRYADVARLFVKYGRGPLAESLGREFRDEKAAQKTDEGGDPEALARDLEKLGPTFIKLGQLLSSRADLLPTPYLEALSRLQDDVAPFDFSEVQAIVARELRVPLTSVFAEFETVPLAAASLGQVHRARLRNGRVVAVKVQRPGVRQQIEEDLEALSELAAFLDRHSSAGSQFEFEKTVATFGQTLLGELDYRREAANMARLHRNLERFPRIAVPLPVQGATTERVLTMDYVEGRKLTELDPLTRLDTDSAGLADELFEAYLHQVLIDGFFHADPHPGNVLLSPDGRVVLLDVGMVGNIPADLQEGLFRLLLAVGEGLGREAAELALAIAERREDLDEAEFRRRVSEVVDRIGGARVGELQMGRSVLAVARAAGETGARIPSQFTMLGKTLWNLDEIGKTLEPSFDPSESIRRHAPELLRRRMARRLSAGHLAATLLDAKELVQELPKRLNRFFDLLSRNELKVEVDAIDETALIQGLQKIANRIALGVVLAALIIGAAIVLQIPTRLTILGYPAIAMVLFAAAAIGGIALIASIVSTDRRARQRPK
jgi:predicted unusual protein kinase regulating ubiquinone biosynthesis (AarF/ABC1/UbiB family)